MSDSLEDLRRRIQEIDSTIVSLLAERTNVVLKIGTLKMEYDLPIQNKRREKEVLEHILNLPHAPMDSNALKSIFRHIIRVCREMQKKNTHSNQQRDQA